MVESETYCLTNQLNHLVNGPFLNGGMSEIALDMLEMFIAFGCLLVLFLSSFNISCSDN